MNQFALRLRFLLAVSSTIVVAECRADDSQPRTSLTHTASEIPELKERGFDVPADGEYFVKIWSPGKQIWSVGHAGTTLTLKSKTQGDDAKMRWQSAGTARLKRNVDVKLVIEEPKPTEEKKKTDHATKDSAPSTAPLPVLLTISNDPAYSAESAESFDLIRGDDTSGAPTHDLRRGRVRTNQQGADFQAPETAEEWNARARDVRTQLKVTLGLSPTFHKTPLNPKVVGKLERNGYTIEKVSLETFPGFYLAGNLYRPIGKPGKLPLVLCPHGHWAEGRVNVDVQARCVRWAKLGCVVFLYDMVGYADSKPFGHKFLNDRLRLWGLSLITLQTWNSIRALDWLTSLPDVDPARVACTGESGGGTQTFLLTAMDDRIKVSAPVVMVSDSFQGGCVCENCAGLRIGLDNVEIAALTAPRPLKLVGATGDWTAKTMTNAYPTIRSVYALIGDTNRVSADVFDFPHNYNQTSRNAVYAFVGKWLMGIEDSQSTKEGPQSVEKPEDLFVFTQKTPAPANLKTAAALENDLIRDRSWELDALAPGKSAAAWEAARSLLLTCLKVRVGLENPLPEALAQVDVRRAARAGVSIAHSRISRKGSGDEIPVVRLVPTSPAPTGRVTVIASSRGKAGLVDESGHLKPLAKALLGRGHTVVGFDPLFVGESFDPTSASTSRPTTAHFETYNPTVAADQLQDLATVLAWARAQGDIREVSLIGQDLAGPQALIASPALLGLTRVAVDLGGFNEGDGSKRLPRGLDLPGLLQFGGLKSAAALAAPVPLWIHGAGDSFDRSWPENGIQTPAECLTSSGSKGIIRLRTSWRSGLTRASEAASRRTACDERGRRGQGFVTRLIEARRSNHGNDCGFNGRSRGDSITMRRLPHRAKEPGPIENIRVGELPTPEPRPGEVLVKVGAASLNPIDLYVRSGQVPMPLAFPYILGCDVAGTVEAVGPGGQTRLKVGDRVWGSNQGLLGRQGVCAEYAAIDEHWLYLTPSSVSDQSAAALALTGLTAHLGLFERGRLRPGETVYVPGGAGGVGSAVVQMARAAGAKVVTSAGSPEKIKLCESLGADLALNYKTDDIPARLHAFAPEGIDVWYETQREPNLEVAVPLLRKRGRMILMAGRAAKPVLPLGSFYPRDCSLLGFAMFNATPDELRRAADGMNHWVANGELKAHIGRVFPLKETAAAEKFLEENTVGGAGTLSGKVVIAVSA